MNANQLAVKNVNLNGAPTRSPGGFLIVTALIGFGLGSSLVYLYARSQGETWFTPKYFNPAIAGMLSVGFVCLSIGWILDSSVRNFKTRKKLLRLLWLLFIIGIFVFMLILPAFQTVRE